jgi:hypothetical protein
MRRKLLIHFFPSSKLSDILYQFKCNIISSISLDLFWKSDILDQEYSRGECANFIKLRTNVLYNFR